MSDRVLPGWRLLVLAALFLTASPVLAEGKKYALLVGIKDYEHSSLGELKYTEHDAEALAAVLRSKAIGFDEVVLLTSSSGAKNDALKPTAKNIRAQLKRLSDKVTKHDMLVLALAGHGLQLEVVDPRTNKKSEESFFCPSDARPKVGGTLAELKQTMLPMLELFKELDECGAGVRLVLVDACRNEPKSARNMDVEARPSTRKGTAVLFSCKGGERAFETNKLGKSGHGVYFHFVIEGLKGKAKNDRGEITWSRLSDYVIEQVSESVPKLVGNGARQTPHEIRNLEGKSPVLGKSAAVVNTSAIEAWYKEALKLYDAKKDAEGLALFTKAADAGHGGAMNYIGWMHQNGYGVPASDAKALEWYRKSVAKGHDVGMWNLGWMYEHGRGVKQDYKQAMGWYRKAADLGHLAAMDQLGFMYENGIGETKNLDEAVRWYRKAANGGFGNSLNQLGWMYQNGIGVKVDIAEAVKLYEKGAEKGNNSAMYNLAWLYQNGKIGKAADFDKAMQWYKKSADAGNAGAMNQVGWFYQNGLGVKVNDAEAVTWYRKGAEKDNLSSMNNLAWMYEQGRGVKQDYSVAIQWYTKATEKGSTDAMYNLGAMYEDGRGVAKSIKGALKWYRMAAAKGDEESKKKVQMLEKQDF